MAVTQIDPLSTPPSRKRPETFAEEGDQFLSELPDFATQANALAEDVNSLATTADSASVLSTSMATAAANSAAAVGSISGAAAYSAVTVYAKYDNCYGATNGLLYRCLTAGTVGDDPEASSTGNWLALENIREELGATRTGNFTFSIFNIEVIDCSLSSIQGITPGSPSRGDKISFIDYNRTFGINNFQLTYNGVDKIEGLVESMIFDKSLIHKINLVYVDSTIGWRLI